MGGDMDRHDVDPTSLAFGLLFTISGLMLVSGNPAGGTVWLGWTGPAVAIALGLLVVLAVRPTRKPSGDAGNPEGGAADVPGEGGE
jgi:hypothetical protein